MITKATAVAALVCAAGTQLQSASAQEQLARAPQEQDSINAPEVVVTGQRFSVRQRELPIGISVITAREIRDSGAQTVPDVLSRQVGFVVRDNFGSPNRQIDLRGFGGTGDQNTLILLNGQRISENELTPADLASVSLNSVDRVEILRSSGAVLYGGGATGGTVNIITRTPEPGARYGSVDAIAGNYGTYGLGGGGTIGGEKFALSVYGNRYASDNYRRNNDLVQSNVAGTITYHSDRGPVSLRFSEGSQDLRLPASRTEAQLKSDPRGTDTLNDYLGLETSRVTLGTTQNFDWAEIGIDVGHRERRSRSFQFGGFADLNSRVSNVAPRIKIPISLGPVEFAQIVGVDWDQWKSNNRFDAGGFVSFATAEQENRAGYLQSTARFPWDMVASLGFRQQNVRTELTEQPADPQIQRRTLRAWEIALRQSFFETFALYGKFGRSFRMPTTDENRFRTTLLEPQTSRDAEAGVEFDNARQRVRLSVFESRLTNEILFLPAILVPPFGENVNLPPTRRRGVELDGGSKLADTWYVAANYTYTQGEFREGSFAGQDVAGKDIPLVPKHKAGVSVAWQATERWRLTLSGTYVGTQLFDNDQANTFGRKMPAYALADFITAYDAGAWRLKLSVLNVLDKDYFSYAIANTATGSFNAYPALGRTFLMSGEYRFGASTLRNP